jgi:hypothetical protein
MSKHRICDNSMVIRLPKIGGKYKGALLAFAAGCAVAAVPAMANSISRVEGDTSGTVDTIGDVNGNGDPVAVVSAILSQPGTGDGYTYSNWSFLANDGTGSLDLFGKIPAATPYTPTVGDGVTATGTYSPFDGIPEIESLTSITKYNGGNTVPSPIVMTLPQVNAVTASDYSHLEYLLTLNDVSIVQTGTWPTHANMDFTITDQNTTTEGFLWASSYSVEDQFAGTAIPGGLVDMTGFLSIFSGVPQFTPVSITVVPEPASLGLLALGGITLLGRRRRIVR